MAKCERDKREPMRNLARLIIDNWNLFLFYYRLYDIYAILACLCNFYITIERYK